MAVIPLDVMNASNTDFDSDGGGTATAAPPLPRLSKPRARRLPPWKVLLHNDDVNEVLDVVSTVMQLTALNREDAIDRTLEAHTTGVSLLMTTHREHAELLEEQFTSKRLTVTIEPDR